MIHARRALLPTGWAENVRITISGGHIETVTHNTPPHPSDETAATLIPGLANLHSHAFQRAMAGLAETRGPDHDNFWTWREAMYRFASTMTPDDAEAVAAQAYMEMLEAGFTRVGEFHYLHHTPTGAPYANPAEMAERIAAAAQTAHIGLTLLPVFYAHAGFGGTAPLEGQRRFTTPLAKFARLMEASRAAIAGLPGANLGVAPHSLRAVTQAELIEVTKLGDGPIHIHVAEQTGEVDACLSWSGARPVEFLFGTADVNASWCLIHATHMTPRETETVAESGAVAGLCPITEANLGDGIFPLQTYLAHHGSFGIGSDSNVLISAAGELRQLEYAQRLHHRARNIAPRRPGASTGDALLTMALAGGAQALASASALAPGNEANLVAIEGTPDSWIFAGTRITTVWHRGQQVVTDGTHIAREAIAGRYATTLKRLKNSAP